MSPGKGRQNSGKSAIDKASRGFTDEELAAMRERAQELKAAARRGPGANEAEQEKDVLAKMTEMPEPDRAMAERLHAIIKASAPGLSPRTWYRMPAYATVVCFFQSAEKFKARYATLGFSDKASLDEGAMWPTAFALKALSPTGGNPGQSVRPRQPRREHCHRGGTHALASRAVPGADPPENPGSRGTTPPRRGKNPRLT